MALSIDAHGACGHDESECEAYNAAFYELGFRWHWDSEVYAELQGRAAEPAARVRHYLETRQPHLLRAYEPEFLIAAIEEAAARHRRAPALGTATASRRFDWAAAVGREVGV